MHSPFTCMYVGVSVCGCYLRPLHSRRCAARGSPAPGGRLAWHFLGLLVSYDNQYPVFAEKGVPIYTSPTLACRNLEGPYLFYLTVR